MYFHRLGMICGMVLTGALDLLLKMFQHAILNPAPAGSTGHVLGLTHPLVYSVRLRTACDRNIPACIRVAPLRSSFTGTPSSNSGSSGGRSFSLSLAPHRMDETPPLIMTGQRGIPYIILHPISTGSQNINRDVKWCVCERLPWRD
jgi:hypothetical protein